MINGWEYNKICAEIGRNNKSETCREILEKTSKEVAHMALTEAEYKGKKLVEWGRAHSDV